ncbi:hypothetical protein K491DRAFT_153539 [Lophiostoma macrostomum CBS 122681]|uniref:Uncharacterized protein n=1 Tax=Lophiostoma macrostomum CBS 122681 TaxID=1314788 RepID=A0A6A6TIZ2_9PLEO|nr:hypothetical protein K491DRAFT_153539 [Lophiostoma macrostomum CBS 122681]
MKKEYSKWLVVPRCSCAACMFGGSSCRGHPHLGMSYRRANKLPQDPCLICFPADRRPHMYLIWELGWAAPENVTDRNWYGRPDDVVTAQYGHSRSESRWEGVEMKSQRLSICAAYDQFHPRHSFC